MAYNSGIISAPVVSHPTTGDIQRALGVSAGGLIELYRHANVNPWSRKKPVPWSTASELVVDPYTRSDWYKGRSGNFGIISKSNIGYSQLPNHINGALNGWTYQRDEYCCRQLDFDGYYHAARNPFQRLNISYDRTAYTSGVSTLILQYRYTTGTTSGEIDLSEIYVQNSGGAYVPITSLYIGFVVYRRSGSSWIYHGWATSSSTLTEVFNDPAMHYVQLGITSTGTYRFVPMLSLYAKTSSNSPSDLVTIPLVNFTEFTVSATEAPSMVATVYALNDGTGNYGNTLYYRSQFSAGMYTADFDNISLVFRSQLTQNIIATITNVQRAGSSGSLRVNAGQTAYVPSGEYKAFTWPSSTVTLTDYINNHGRKFLMTGSGADDFDGTIDTPAQPPRV